MSKPPPLGTDLSAMRRLNSTAVLTLLWDEAAGLTAAELSGRGRLSRSTVDTLLTELVREDLLEVVAADAPRVGRPARRYRIAAQRGAVIGIDLGPRGATGAIGDLRGSPLLPATSLEGDLLSARDAADAVSRIADRLVAGTRHRLDEVESLAVSIPAVVDLEGRAARSIVAPDWVSDDLPAQLTALFPAARVTVGNDTKLAAIAELAAGGIDPGETAVLLRVDERISAATVLSGTVAQGAHGAAGEIGALRRLGWLDETPDLPVAAPRAARDAALARFAETIADGLAALVLAIDADAVAVAAGDEEISRQLADALRDPLGRRTLYPPRVRGSQAGRSGSLTGALLAASDQVRRSVLNR